MPREYTTEFEAELKEIRSDTIRFEVTLMIDVPDCGDRCLVHEVPCIVRIEYGPTEIEDSADDPVEMTSYSSSYRVLSRPKK